MNRELARKVANAVLYEGYMLYPYRPSALKNRQRWSFGILYPPVYHEVERGTERSQMHTECLVEANFHALLHVELRFLQLISRQVHRRLHDQFEPVPSLAVDHDLVESFDEAVERSVEFEIAVNSNPGNREFNFAANTTIENINDQNGVLVGNICRSQNELRGTVSAEIERLPENVWKLSIDVSNRSPAPGNGLDRNRALLASLLSAHHLLTVVGGEFVSLLDPPEHLRIAARACANVGNFPVLTGDIDDKDILLCSPILLYDHPEVAPESAAEFFDATEIDEMLTLRIMTLTEEEKDQMRRADARVRNLLDCVMEGAREHLLRTHGTIRGMRRQ